MRLTVLRHPRVLEPHVCYGRLDVAIASGAETEAILEARCEEWRERLFGDASVGLVSSPRTRCRFVADWLSARFERRLLVDARIAEMDLGSFEGVPFVELERRPEFEAFMGTWETATAPDGESIPRFEGRVAEALRSAIERRRDEVWVAHAGVIRALRVLVEGARWSDAMNEPIPYLEPIAFSLDPP